MTTTTSSTAGPAEEGPKSSNMRSLSRAMEVFAELQRAERPQRLSDLARNCGMSLPTTLRILRVLQDFGMVSQTDKSYRIGPAVLPAARSFLENDPLVVAARPILQQLASQTGLTASLYSRLGFERILVARVDGEAPLRYDLPAGQAAAPDSWRCGEDPARVRVGRRTPSGGHGRCRIRPGGCGPDGKGTAGEASRTGNRLRLLRR
ncbi:hypothetical protein QFZ60_004016 [Arthrobacter sp. B2I5]|nr:hypothetical protein [Arthrobacter sp. B2I5]